LADGLFAQRLQASDADVVSDPLGLHPGLPRLIATRFRWATRGLMPAATSRRGRAA
jgi:sirohydrochlorin ferrochelatase